MSVTVSEDLLWLASVLWGGGGAEVRIGREESSPLVLDRYAVIPSAARPRFLVPMGSRAGASATLRAYNALRPPSQRFARWAVAAGLRAGAAQRLLQDRLEVRIDTTEGAPKAELLMDHLREIFGGRDLLVGVGVGRPDPYRKPVLQVFDGAGEPLGYMKVGWNEVTRRQVRNEAEALRHWGESGNRIFRVPPLLHSGTWRQFELCVVAPLPRDVRRCRPAMRPPSPATIKGIAALHGTTESRLGESTYLRRLVGRATEAVAVGDGRVASAVAALIAHLEDRQADVGLTFGTWHGDLAPWNLCRNGESLHVFDWEHCCADVPLGFDILHFLFQVGWLAKGQTVPQAVERMKALGPPMLLRLGVEPEAVNVVAELYLLEIFLRTYEAMRAGGRTNPRFYPGILNALELEGARPDGL